MTKITPKRRAKAWKLVTENERWLRKQGGYYFRMLSGRGIHLVFEDLMQEVRIAAFHGALRWDPKRARFTTYANYWIRVGVRTYLHSQLYWYSQRRRTPSVSWIEDSKFPNGEPYGEIARAISGPGDSEREMEAGEVRAALALLPDRLKKVAGELSKERTLESVSKDLGVTRERVRQIMEDALYHLRKQVLRGERAA